MMIDLAIFFKENSPENTTLTVDFNGEIHFIETDILIETLLNTSGEAKNKVSDSLLLHVSQDLPLLDFLQEYANLIVIDTINDCTNNNKTAN